jgi:iron-sulfur cluster repair protein YtfE (RIC family)
MKSPAAADSRDRLFGITPATSDRRRFRAMTSVSATAFTTARRLILAQHQELRGLLRTGAVLAGAASRGDRPCLNELPNLIESLRAKFAEHLTFEDVTLGPVLRQGNSVDVSHADHLATDHQRQLREFDILLRLAQSSGDPEAVAYSFQALLNTLLTDMDEEERWLLQIETGCDLVSAIGLGLERRF